MQLITPAMPVLPRCLLKGATPGRYYVVAADWTPVRYVKSAGWFVPAKDINSAEFNLALTITLARRLAASPATVTEDGQWRHSVFLFEYDAVPFMGLHPDHSYERRMEKLAELTVASDTVAPVNVNPSNDAVYTTAYADEI